MKIRKPNLIFVLIGVICSIKIYIYNSLCSPFELLALIFFVSNIIFNLNNNSKLIKTKIFNSIRNLLFFWAAIQFISDVYNESSFNDLLKGVGTPLLILLSVNLFLFLYEKSKSNLYFVSDIFIGVALTNIFYGLTSGFSLETYLKFGGIIKLLSAFVCLIPNNYINFGATIFMALLSILFQIRSVLMQLILFIILKIKIFNKFKISFPILSHNPKTYKIVLNGLLNYLVIIFILIISNPLFDLATNIFTLNNFNNDRAEVIKDQIDTNSGIFAARIEYYSFFSQFIDSPIFGHGSWANDEEYKYVIESERRSYQNKGLNDYEILRRIKMVNYLENRESFIPFHSYIMQVVTWGGIFAASFFFYLLNISIYALIKKNLYTIEVLFLVNHIFNTLFSPIGSHRFIIPIVCLMLMIIYLRKDFDEKSSKNIFTIN